MPQKSFRDYHIRQKARKINDFPSFLDGGDGRDRTVDLLNAIQALSQLSYTPIFFHIHFLFLRYPFAVLWGVCLYQRQETS